MDVYGHWVAPAAGVDLRELPLDGPGHVELEGLVVRSQPANHTAGALHYRFEADGYSVVFSGDTGPSENLVELATGANLLVCECAASDDARVKGHMYPTAVAELVRAARPEQVWLTHLYPRTRPEPVLRTVGAHAPVRHAADGDVWTSPS